MSTTLRLLCIAAATGLLVSGTPVGHAQQDNGDADEQSPRAEEPREAPPPRETPPPADDDVFVPTEELQADEEVTFPVDI